MLSRHLHSLSLALVLGTLAVILSGAAQFGAPAGEPHRGLSGLVALLAVLTTVGSFGHSRTWLKRLSLACLVTVLALGTVGVLMTNSPWAVLLHACLSHLLFASAVALMVATSPGWSAPPEELVSDTGSPSLRTVSLVVPWAVMLQIVLGAIYRHLSLPVWPHLVGSLLVGCLLLYTGMVALEAEEPVALVRSAAHWLLTVTVLQIAFGLGAFLGRVMASDGMAPEWWMIFARTMHVATGALTLGASVAYAMQVFYHVQPGARPHPTGENKLGKSVVA